MDQDSIGPHVPFRQIRTKSSGQDAYAWWCYFLLGAGVLCPWNAFITGVDYFEALWPAAHMSRLFTVCYLPTCLVWLGIMVRWPRLVTNRTRILTGYLGFTAVLLLVPLIDTLMVGDAGPAPRSAQVLVLLGVVAVGVLDGISQGALFGDASQLPPRFTHAVVSGTAASGSLICLLRIATKASASGRHDDGDVDALRASARLYLSLSALLCLCCAAVYALVLPRLPLVQFYRSKAEAAGGRILEMAVGSIGTSLPHSTAPVRGRGLLDAGSEAGGAEEGEASGLLSAHSWHDYSDDLVTPETLFQTSSTLTARHDQNRIRTVLGATWPLALALFLVYVVTLSIFPGFLAEDTHSVTLGSWYPILLITAFNIADLAGKTVPHTLAARTQHRLLLLAAVRMSLVPCFVLAAWLHAPVAVMAGLTLVLGFSNGLFTARAMTMAPALVADSAADLALNLLVFCLVAGLTVGAALGWLWLLAAVPAR